jgi:thioredoxin reductase (NADPH)
MPKPVLFTVDDDPEVLRAIERDLRSHYSDRYRVMRANSGSAALFHPSRAKARNNPVALLLADQRMPQMNGVGFLSEAMETIPAKRALPPPTPTLPRPLMPSTKHASTTT